MYNVPYFKEKDRATILAFMQQHPFVMLIGSHDGIPVATQVPMLVEEVESGWCLYGHMMRKTDHHLALEKNPAALCVFTGPHTYVSARWYTQPHTASTWNYMSVHARGPIQFLDEAGLKVILEKTTSHFENDAHSPASFHNLSDDYINSLAKAIVGFKIEVASVEAIFKLSQNRDAASYHTIINALQQGDAGAQQVAAEMEKKAGTLFT